MRVKEIGPAKDIEHDSDEVNDEGSED